MILWPADLASRVGDVCSGLGLVVTALLTGGAIRERNRLLKLIFYPKYVDSLRDHCKQLNALLGRSQPKEDVERLIGQARGDLNTLRPYLQKNQHELFDDILNHLGRYEQSRSDDDLRRLIPKMYQLEKEARNLSEGMKY